MRIETIQYDDVPEDGQIGEAALVPVDGSVSTSPPDGGCGIAGCPCLRGHYFMRLYPRDNHGTVFGYIAEFESREELEATSEEQIVALARRAMN
jgi:hypothetical protein